MLSETQYGVIGSVAAAVALAAFAKAAETYRARQGVARTRTTYLPCRRTATLEVLVVHQIAGGDGLPVPGALVEVDEAGLYAYSPGDGTPATFTVPPGNYTVRALKDWYLPENGAEQAGVVLVAGARVRVTLRMSSFELHLHVDADRDGAVDADRTGLDRWNWGAGQKGAVVMCNNDDDDAVLKNASDNAVGDATINGAADLTDIAPLDIRRGAEGIAQPPIAWRATLAVTGGNETNLRVFATRTAGAAEVVGPGAGPSHTFAAGDFNNVQRLDLGMEALRYAGTGFTGEVDITFTLTRPAAGFWAYLRDEFTYTERARLRVAPWLMFHHSDTAQELYVRDDGGANAVLRAALQPLVNAILGANPTEVPLGAGDRWMQDCMEIGYSRLPGRGFVPAVLKMPPNTGLHAFPPTLRGANFGYHQVGVQGSNSRFDAGGNLEATPPAKEPDGLFRNGKIFPFGRIYFCPAATGLPPDIARHAPEHMLTMDVGLQAFLRAQRVQSPFELDSSWLYVGHVDEIVSFVPCVGPQYMAYRLLIASPRRAYEILETLDGNGNGHQVLLTGFTAAPVTVHDILTTGIPDFNYDAAKVRADNDFCQQKLDAALAVLRRNLDLPGVIEVPVLFSENHMMPGLYDAFTADMVNLVVLGNRCIVPKAFGPGPAVVHPTQLGYNMDQFEHDLYQQLTAIAVTPLFIDEFAYLHMMKGEIHCGTNVRRQPFAPPAWWEFQP